MTPREKNLWGLIAGLVLAIGFGVYKISHSDIAVTADSPSVETVHVESQPSEDLNGSDVGMYGEDDADVNVTDMAATDMYTEEEAKHEIPPQNLLPENATDAAAVDDQPDGGEE